MTLTSWILLGALVVVIVGGFWYLHRISKGFWR